MVQGKNDNDKIVVYSNYNTLSEAYEARNVLESCGIPCFISNENMAAVYPMFDSSVGGVSLNIFEKDRERAREILQTP